MFCSSTHDVPQSGWDEIDKREDDDPHDVNEVPIQTDKLNYFSFIAYNLVLLDDEHK
jgi:hypothetical protein